MGSTLDKLSASCILPYMTNTTPEAEAFFYKHAGHSWNPATETEEEGHKRSARKLAEAEAWAKAAGVSFSWSSDWGVGSHLEEFDCYDEEPESCEACVATLGNVSASLGCIDDASDEYRRVIQAELAEELMSDPATREAGRLLAQAENSLS